ncbi:MAG: flagellar motor switch protein FliN [Bryobacteraceae bacterium]
MQARDWIVENWAGQLTDVLLMMTGLEFQTEIAPAEIKPANGWIWYEQALSIAPHAALVVAASPAAWSEIGTRVLQAADVDLVEQSAARSTYSEVLQQSLSGLARAISDRFGVSVECEEGQEAPGSPLSAIGFTFVSNGSPLPPLYLSVPDELIQALEPPPKLAAPLIAPLPMALSSQLPLPSAQSKTIDVLLDVEMPVSICFGRAELPLRDVLKLGMGSVVELNRRPDEPVDIVVNNCIVARGEVVVLDGNYGVRIQEIVSRQQRLALKHSEGGVSR